jgi:hypothetical protein
MAVSVTQAATAELAAAVEQVEQVVSDVFQSMQQHTVTAAQAAQVQLAETI